MSRDVSKSLPRGPYSVASRIAEAVMSEMRARDASLRPTVSSPVGSVDTGLVDLASGGGSGGPLGRGGVAGTTGIFCARFVTTCELRDPTVDHERDHRSSSPLDLGWTTLLARQPRVEINSAPHGALFSLFYK
jgi:hypothetical protein